MNQVPKPPGGRGADDEKGPRADHERAAPAVRTFAGQPDETGHFGAFGGSFIPETLSATLAELITEYESARNDPEFWNELGLLLRDYVGRLRLPLAQFTVLTPFPHTRTHDDLAKDGRILHSDWKRYTAGEVVFQPKKMSEDKLQEMYHWAWDTFYKDAPHALKMGRVLKKAMRREEAWGTKGRFPLPSPRTVFGKAVER